MPFIFLRVFFPGIVIAQIAIKGVDLFPRLECWKRSEELQKRILTGSRRTQNRPSVLEDELHTIPLIRPRRWRTSIGTVICPLLLMVLDGGIFTSSPYSKDSILYLIQLSTGRRT